MKRQRPATEELKQTVNYGTGSGTCERCGESIGKGVLRIGR